MTRLRALLLAKGPTALWLLAFAFAVRALVPQGYMVAPGRLFALIPCPEVAAPAAASAHHAGMEHSVHRPARHHDGGNHGGADKVGDGMCAFAPLSQGATPGADPVLLIAALALVFAATLVGAAPAPAVRRRIRLQPPLRGPPAAA